MSTSVTMNSQRPLDLERYRRMKEKMRVSPRAAVVTSEPIKDFNRISPDPSQQRSMIPVASAYREAPSTPLLAGKYSCGALLGSAFSAPKALPPTETTPKDLDTPNRQQQLTASLFDEAKRQRLEKLRSRSRESPSPHSSFVSAPSESHERGRSVPRSQSVPRRPSRSPSIRPRRRDPDESYNYRPNRMRSKAISPSRGSAFTSPARSEQQEQKWSRIDDKYSDLPGPPSVAPSLSSHPLNTYGLPLAPSKHAAPIPTHVQASPASKSSNHWSGHNQTTRSSPQEPPSGTQKAKKLQARDPPIHRPRQFQSQTAQGTVTVEKRALSAPRPRGSTPTTALRPQTPVPKVDDQPRSSSRSRLTPNGQAQTGGKKFPFQPKFASKAPPIIQTCSSERGVSPPPESWNASRDRTPKSVDQSMDSSSTARRDRILESRGITQPSVFVCDESREPLNEIRTQADSSVNERTSSGQSSIHLRPSLEIPSLKSYYSEETSKTGASTQENQRKSTATPVDFYRQITAAKTRQLAFAKKRGDLPSKPTVEKKADPVKKSSTPAPLYRNESSRDSAVPQLDQKTVRLLYSSAFAEMVNKHAENETTRLLNEYQRSNPAISPPENGVSVIARKRPFLQNELDSGEFDVVNADPGSANTMIVYETSLLQDLKTKDIHPSVFEFDQVFSETSSAEDFYLRTGQPAVLRARQGSSSMFVVYGDKLSGKSHAIADISERAGFDLFGTENEDLNNQTEVQVFFMEISKSHITDLLGPIGSFVRIVDERGRYHFRGCVSKTAYNPDELLTILSDAHRRREMAISHRGNSDNQSFCLCQINVHTRQHQGSLFFLECPSSELLVREDDSLFEGLMRSIQARVAGKLEDNPFIASNNITKALQHPLVDPKSHIGLIAAVSPVATCTENTLAALGVSNFMLQSRKPTNAVSHTGSVSLTSSTNSKDENSSPRSTTSDTELTMPRQWTHEDLVQWMTRKNLLGNEVPEDVDGKIAMRMSKRQLMNTFYDVMETDKAEKLFLALRAENDRVARLRVKQRMARDLKLTARS